MKGIIICATLSFFLYFLACRQVNCNHKYRNHLLVVFVVSTFALRCFIDPRCNNDYYLYFDFQIFSKPTSVLSFILNEPYMYGVYCFFNLFSTSKTIVFEYIYWFNHIIAISFFVWLLLRREVAAWKKIILFALFYPVLDLVFLRNAPVYILFAMNFYYSFRNEKFKAVFLTPFMHISSLLLFPILFHRVKHYYSYFISLVVIGVVCCFILMPYLVEIEAFRRLLFKINAYSNMGNLNVKMHIIFLASVLGATVFFALIYKKRLLHPILVSTFLLYFCSFFFNVSVAYRFALYYVFALFLFGGIQFENVRVTKYMNQFSFLMFPVFIYSFCIAHKACF